jgi:uncharacterized protein YvpB
MNLKRLAIAIMVCGALGGLYMKYSPALTYWSGKFASKMYHTGKTAGTSTVRLNVPFHRQEHSLSCEVASLKMALAGVGVEVPESELVAKLAYDSTPRTSGVWGDPYVGFVGDIDGKMLGSGYGVYWDPIAKLGLQYRNTEVIHNGSLQQLLYHIHQGRPVVVWGYFGRGNRTTWTTPNLKTVDAVNGEHARVLIGYNGNSLNPDSLILMDPIYGEQTWSVQDFLNNWSTLESAGVAVYQQPKWVRTTDDATVWEISAEGKVRQALVMDWKGFVNRGGLPEGVVRVSQEWLSGIPEGAPIFTDQSMAMDQ